MRRLALAIACLGLLALPGCKGKCRQLSEKLCECSSNSLVRDSCLRQVTSEESRIEPTADDEDVCEALRGIL